tara:strand:- start:1841 stop:2473 length:633 start_codon:yes stop_codon:yes gene_type:complete
MNYKIKTIDNFLEKKDLESLNSLKFNPIVDNGVSYYQCLIDKNNNFINSENENKIINNIFEKYNDILLKILKELNLEKLDLYDYSMISLARTGKDFKFPIHDDTPEKILSGVIYLNPEINSGTNFYDGKHSATKKSVEWKKNRAVFFSREERKTWHSFEGHEAGERRVLVYNLCTKQLKKVFHIEKKNYLYGMLRYKLNPYIFKIFKSVI